MRKKYNTTQIVGIILLVVIGLNALFAGSVFILHPDGSAMGLSDTLLQYSPFEDFLFPGIILLVFNGISSIVIAILTVRENRYYSLLIIIQGIVLVIWLILQMVLLRHANALQLIMLCCGMGLIVIGELISNK